MTTAGADANLANSRGETPLYISAHEGSIGVMEHVLRGGSDMDHPCGREGLTPLMASIANERLSTARILIKVGTPLCPRFCPSYENFTCPNSQKPVKVSVKTGAKQPTSFASEFVYNLLSKEELLPLCHTLDALHYIRV